jgi:hypothetical protein
VDFIRGIMSELSATQRKQLRSFLSIIFRAVLRELNLDNHPDLPTNIPKR